VSKSNTPASGLSYDPLQVIDSSSAMVIPSSYHFVGLLPVSLKGNRKKPNNISKLGGTYYLVYLAI